MKKSKIINIIALSLPLLICLISFIMALVTNEVEAVRPLFINLILVSLGALIANLVMVILSKTKLIMIPMLVTFINAFLSFNLFMAFIIYLTSDNSGSGSIDISTTTSIDAFSFVIIALSVVGIIFTCLKHKWGAILGIVGISFMIFNQNILICLLSIASKGLGPIYSVLACSAAAILFQFIWLLVPMISLLCEKKEETPKVEETTKEESPKTEEQPANN